MCRRCCCADFFLYTVGQGSALTAGDSVRAVRLNNESYRSTKVTIKPSPKITPGTNIAPLNFCVDYRHKLVFGFHVVTGPTRRVITRYDMGLRKQQIIAELSGAIQTLFMACDWQTSRVYYAIRTASSTSPNTPVPGISTESYTYEIRAVNYAGTSDELIATESGTAVGSGAFSQIGWGVSSPLEGGQLYYSFTKTGTNVTYTDTDNFGYLKKVNLDSGAISTILTYEDPFNLGLGDYLVRGQAISARQQKLIWCEQYDQVGGIKYEVKVGDLNAGGASSIFQAGIGTANPNFAPRFVYFSEREDKLYIQDFKILGTNTWTYLRRCNIDGSDLEMVLDTGMPTTNGPSQSLGGDTFVNARLALGCQREFMGDSYQGDG